MVTVNFEGKQTTFPEPKDVLEGYSFIGVDENGYLKKQHGTMPRNRVLIKTIKVGEIYKIPYGYHTGEDTFTHESFADATPATATPDKLLKGYAVYANGVKIEGNIPVNSYPTIEMASAEYNPTDGYTCKVKNNGYYRSITKTDLNGSQTTVHPGFFIDLKKVVAAEKLEKNNCLRVYDDGQMSITLKEFAKDYLDLDSPYPTTETYVYHKANHNLISVLDLTGKGTNSSIGGIKSNIKSSAFIRKGKVGFGADGTKYIGTLEIDTFY